MSWLFVHLPGFALEVRSRTLPDSGPQVLIEPGGSEILLVNPAAASLGIRPGMSLSTAFSLQPDVQLLTRHPALEQSGLRDLAQLLYGYAAQISLKPPQGLLLEIGSMLRLFRGLENLWQQIEESVRQQGFEPWLATAHTPLAAQLLAQAGGIAPTLDATTLQHHLNQLDVSQLGLPPTMTEPLQRMGIRQLAQLLELPAAELGRRFSQALLLHLNRLLGRLADPQEFFTPPQSFVRRLEFVEDVETTAGLLFPLQRLLRELALFLQQRQRVTPWLRLALGHRERPETLLEIRSVQPEYRADEWLQLCRLRLERIQLYAGVQSLSLAAEELLPFAPPAEDLFCQQRQLHLNRLQLLSRLQARLGPEQVLGMATRADHRPESVAISVPPGQGQRSASKAEPDRTAARPLWLLPQPQPALPGELQLLQGPERIQAGWWDDQAPQAICRDYYIARTRNGSLCWAFRTPEQAWFIHGWFA